MIDTTGPRPLGPLQRAYCKTSVVAQNRLTFQVSGITQSRMTEVLRQITMEMPRTSVGLVENPLLTVPDQVYAQPSVRTSGKDSDGTNTPNVLQCIVSPRDADRLLVSLEAPAALLDMASLQMLARDVSERICTGANELRNQRPFDVEVAHLDMAHRGDLRDDEDYWRAARRGDTRDVRPWLSGTPWTAEPQEATYVLEENVNSAIAVQAQAANVTAVELALFSLHLMKSMIGDNRDILQVGDARSTMGLEGLLGCFSGIYPTSFSVDPSDNVLDSLRHAIDIFREDVEHFGSPGLRLGDEQKQILFRADIPLSSADASGGLLQGGNGPEQPQIEFRVWMEPAQPPTLSVLSATPQIAGEARAYLDLWAHTLRRVATANAHDVVSDLSYEQFRIETVHTSTVSVEADAGEGVVELMRRQPPEKVALSFGDGTEYTFGELLDAAARIELSMAEAGPGDIISVVGEWQSHVLIPVMLGVIAHGSAFMNFTPNEPPERVKRAEAAAHSPLRISCHSGPGDPTFEVLGQGIAPAGERPSPREARGQVAYAMRTSGSTGDPKIVLVSNHSLDNYLTWCRNHLYPEAVGLSTLPVITPATFDAHLKQTLGQLAAGRVVTIPGSAPSDVEALLDELESWAPQSVTLNCVPSLWRVILASLQSRPRPRLSLHALLLGGEPLDPTLVATSAALLPGVEIYNLYGPTETTATATMSRVDPSGRIHVGNAIADASIHITDTFGGLLPRCISGDVVISGPGVALGYKGVTHNSLAFFEAAGRRYYKTGDVGFLDSRGSLYILGRRDTQVKVRGWRLELGEIESLCLEVPGVKQAIAVVNDSESISLFFVSPDVDVETVRYALAQRLPEALQPARLERVRSMPLTTSGKINRDFLRRMPSVPERSLTLSDLSVDEMIVCREWEAVLGTPPSSLDDDFFDNGGHSLLLARLVGRLRSSGYELLAMRDILRKPTVREIVNACLPSSGTGRPAS